MKKKTTPLPFIFHWDVYILLIVITLAVFAQIRSFEFVSYDDLYYVYTNDHVKSGLQLDNIIWAFKTNYMGHWHPLTWLSYFVDTQIYGIDGGGFHTTNLTLHLINTLLLFFFFQQATGTKWRSAAVAILFAIHPLHVEPVAWVSSRKDLLSTFWGLVALNLYIQYVKDFTCLKYGLITGAFILSLMAKSMLVTLPAIFILMDYWPLNRFETLVKPVLGFWQQVLFHAKEKGALFLISALCIYIEAKSQVPTIIVMPQNIRDQIHAYSMPYPWHLILYVPYNYLLYLKKTFWPTELLLSRPIEYISLNMFIMATLGLILISIALLWIGRRHRYVLIGWCWFMGALVPISHLSQLSDRYTYVPLIGIFIIVAWGSYDLFTKYLNLTLLKVAAVSLLIILCLMSWVQTDLWRDSETLYKHILAVAPNNPQIRINYGTLLLVSRRFEQAVEQFQLVVQDSPNYAGGYFNLGTSLVNLNRFDEAKKSYDQALKLNPTFTEVYSGMGYLFGRQGKYAEAIPYFQKALELKPDYEDARVGLKEAQKLLAQQNKPENLPSSKEQALPKQ